MAKSYLISVIDKIIDYDNHDIIDNVAVDTMDMSPVADSIGENIVVHQDASNGMTLSNECTKNGNECKSYKDFNYPHKEVGYLAQADTNFKFIGPDREPVEINLVEKLITIADSIRNSGVPNYRGVRIPIKSGLNIEAWEKHLEDYADKRVVQYIKLGFPFLSLTNPHELNNTEVTNHFWPASILVKYKSTLKKRLNWVLC